MKRIVLAALAVSISVSLSTVVPARAQRGTDTEILFATELEERARDQLRRLLSEYDLDPWILTREVKIEAGAEPHSMPVLTLNTDFLDDDVMQLSIFVHEQAHWIVYQAEARDAAVEELRRRYPDPPNSAFRTYQHLLVAWVELDAMAELVGEERARRNLETKVKRLTEEPVSEAEVIFRWYNGRVLEDTDEIGAVVADHGLLITPNAGLVVDPTGSGRSTPAPPGGPSLPAPPTQPPPSPPAPDSGHDG